MNKELRTKVEKLFEMDLTSYYISKETGIQESAVRRLKNGEFNMDNLRLSNVEKYAALYDRLQQEKL